MYVITIASANAFFMQQIAVKENIHEKHIRKSLAIP